MLIIIKNASEFEKKIKYFRLTMKFHVRNLDDEFPE